MDQTQTVENGATANLEKYITLKEAAHLFGLPYFKINRAANRNIIPTYTFLNSRRLVRASEVQAIIETSRKGGQ